MTLGSAQGNIQLIDTLWAVYDMFALPELGVG